LINVARLRRGARREAIGVDVPAALAIVGSIVKYLSLTLLFPAAMALGYDEPVWPWLATGAISFTVGWALERLSAFGERAGAREGFLVVALTWLIAPAVSALGYLLAGEEQFSRVIDAYFESMSGFTTTGATVLTDVEGVSHSVAMWRQLSQWLGGMGIIVLALAVLPRLHVGGRQLLERELPGPEVEQLTTRIRDTARRLWLLYIAFTVAMVATLTLFAWSGVDDSMGPYEALAHAFTTLPTGGFSTRARSIEEFGTATQWVIVFFMAVAGANFALWYRGLVRRQPRAFLRDEEFRLYIVLLCLGSALIFTELVAEDLIEGEGTLRHAVFQAVSMMTTTGYASTDFNEWSVFAAVVLIALMLVGGSAGSTGGSVKVVRHLLIGKILRRELDQTVHPDIVSRVRLNRMPIDERTLHAVAGFVLLYVGIFALGTLLLVADAARLDLDLRLLDAVAASATTIGNVGPAFGFAGPMGSFEPFSDFSKIVMIGLMWVGRLEIIPVVVLLTRNYWRA
jgi:trk system potassium uptake protein TrkH